MEEEGQEEEEELSSSRESSTLECYMRGVRRKKYGRDGVHFVGVNHPS